MKLQITLTDAITFAASVILAFASLASLEAM